MNLGSEVLILIYVKIFLEEKEALCWVFRQPFFCFLYTVFIALATISCGCCIKKCHLHYFSAMNFRNIYFCIVCLSTMSIVRQLYRVAEKFTWNTYQQESWGVKFLPLVLDAEPGCYLKTPPSGSWGKTPPPQWPGRILLRDKNWH